MSEGAAHAVKACAALDIARSARASILYVFDAPAIHLAMSHTMSAENRQAYLNEQREKALQMLSTFVKSVDWPSLQEDVRQVVNAPAEEIIEAAKEGSADLIAHVLSANRPPKRPRGLGKRSAGLRGWRRNGGRIIGHTDITLPLSRLFPRTQNF